MKVNELRQAVLNLLHESKGTPIDAGVVAAELRLRGAQKKRLQKVLHDLVREGEIVRIRGNRFTIGSEADLVTGRIDVNRRGDGFVNGADGSLEAFVPRRNMGTALPNDIVVVRVEPEAADREHGKGRIGRVIRVIERARKHIVGRLKQAGKFLCVAAMDPRYKQDFYVPDACGASIGDRVIIRFEMWQDTHVSPEAEVVEVIGPADNPATDTVAAIRHFNLPRAFPGRVMSEASDVAALIDQTGARVDIRDQLILTIDPKRARDFDDALSLRELPSGERELGIHIADVSHFVRPGSALDNEARRRGNSVYLPDLVIPMLPEQLSNGACSLRPDEDRLAFSAFLTLDARGNVTARRFAKTLIRSRLRLTYEQVLPILEQKEDGGLDADSVALLSSLHRAAQQMRKLRFARHALELDAAECEVSVDDAGNPTTIRLVESDGSHQLVEECMLAANEAVARELSDQRVPLIYRVHAPPSPERITDLQVELTSLGYSPGDLTSRRNLARFLKSIKGENRSEYVRIAVLKSLNRAEYSEKREEHFGLAKQFYCHFTSPIRRYPDLIVHRQLALHLAKGRRSEIAKGYTPETLHGTARHCSDTERTADEAERTVVEMKKYRYLQAQLDRKCPEVYEAIVVNATNAGLFVEVPALQVQGLVHISTLSDGFVRYNQNQRSLRAGKTRFGIESRIKVHIAAVDIDNRRLDFALARSN